MVKQFIRLAPGDSADAVAPTLEQPGRAGSYRSKVQGDVLIADVSHDERDALKKSGATFYPDVEFDIFSSPPGPEARREARYWEPAPVAADDAGDHEGLREVVAQINARQAWTRSRGEGVPIAIVHTGICGTLKDFPQEKRSRVDPPSAYEGKHWKDVHGHGSMCAVIAAGPSIGTALFRRPVRAVALVGRPGSGKRRY